MPSLTRRHVLQWTLGASLAPVAAIAQPQGRPIRILVGVAPGNSTDAAARQLAQRLAQVLGQTVYVENKPGGHGAIVAEAVKSAPKDGATLLYSSSGQLAINPTLYPHLNYDPRKDFEPISMVSRGYLYLAVRADSPIRDLSGLVAHVKSRGGRENYGSGGNGTTQHLAMEVLKQRTGMAMPHVPYRGTPMALQDLIGGRILCMFDAGATILPQARQGKVRLIAVTSAQRDPQAPEVQTLAEQGVDIPEITVWSGLLAPAGVPRAAIERVNEAVRVVVKQPDYIAYARTTGGTLVGTTPDEFKSFLDQEIATWAPVVRQSGATID